MSIKALNWAFAQDVAKSGAKFVLVALADHADDYGRAWPCVSTMAGKTAQDRRTVLDNLRALRAAKLIERMPERVGKTRQVVIYRLAMPDLPPHQTPAIPRRRPPNGGGGNGAAKQVQNPHPLPQELSTKGDDLSTKGAENSTETGTKPAPVTIIEPSINTGSRTRPPAGTPARARAVEEIRPWTPGRELESPSGIKAVVGSAAVLVDGVVYQNQALADVAIAERDRAPIPQTVLQYRQSLRARVEVDKKAKGKDDAAEFGK